MVCSGKLDLSTAQRDIATDWIAAYKKYFHTRSTAFRPFRSSPARWFRKLTALLLESRASPPPGRDAADSANAILRHTLSCGADHSCPLLCGGRARTPVAPLDLA